MSNFCVCLLLVAFCVLYVSEPATAMAKGSAADGACGSSRLPELEGGVSWGKCAHLQPALPLSLGVGESWPPEQASALHLADPGLTHQARSDF